MVFHLAGYAHTREEDQVNFCKQHDSVNREGTLILANEVMRAEVERFIFLARLKREINYQKMYFLLLT